MLYALFPILVNRGTQNIPPLTFVAFSVLTGFIFLLIYAFFTKKTKEFKNKKIYLPVLAITLFMVIIPYVMLFIGASKTSGINTTLLLLSEMIFTVLFTPFIGEKTTREKIYGASGIFFGAAFILYNGTFNLNWGDVLIIFSTITYPIGNLFTKKALNLASPATILTIRSFLGGLFLLFLSLNLENNINYIEMINNNWVFILSNGLLIFTISKILDYEAFKRLDISKAIAIFMTYPIFSLILLIFIGEKISFYQWIGFFIIMIGVYFSIKRKSVDPKKTLYAK